MQTEVDSSAAAPPIRRMRFFSDNAASVCPEVMAALAAANAPDTAYDGDAFSRSLDAAFSVGTPAPGQSRGNGNLLFGAY